MRVNVSAKPNGVRSGTRHFPTAKDSAGEESGICWSFRCFQKTGQPRVVAVLWVEMGQFDRQSAGSVGWPPPPHRTGRGLGACRDQADLAGGAVLPYSFMDGANACPAEVRICGSIALAECEAASSSVWSVGLDADCLGQLCQGRLHALAYPFDCA